MAENGISQRLPRADDLFSTQEMREDDNREKVIEISLSEISDFRNHPFQVRLDEAMQEMAESVKQHGVLVPALVRPKSDGGYEMVAGHRRRKASELSGASTIPCIVRNLSDDEAILIMVDSNLQRESVLPSEKAFAYTMKLEAMNRQGQPMGSTSAPTEPKYRSNEKLSESLGESVAQIKRYIRLTQLLPEILQMVDEDKMKLRPAVEVSYLQQTEQQALLETIASEDRTPSHEQALRMKDLSKAGRLNDDVIFAIMTEDKPNQKEHYKLPSTRFSKFFAPGTPGKEVEETIYKALEDYQRRKQRQRER